MRNAGFLPVMILLGLASLAGASTLVDLVAVAEILHIGDFDSDSGTLEVIIRVDRIDMEESATDYFAETFMEYEGASKNRISLAAISDLQALSLAEGSMININYHSVSGIYMSEERRGESYSSERWTYLEELDSVYTVPVNYSISSLQP